MVPRLKKASSCFLGLSCDANNITADGDIATLLLDCGVPGKTPGTVWSVVRIPTEILMQDALRLGGIKLPTVGDNR